MASSVNSDLPFSFGSPALIHRLAAALGLILASVVLHGGITGPSSSMDAFLFMVKDDGELRPVVGVKSMELVLVKADKGEEKTIRMTGAALLPKRLPPIGRVTILEVEGLSQSRSMVDPYFVTNMDNTSINLELVSDTDLEDVYAVVVFWAPGRSEEPADLIFCPIGDLEAGKASRESIQFPNVRLGRGWSFNYYIYCNGLPVEMFQLQDVAEKSGSDGLMLPWEVRMDYYLHQARESKRSSKPKPFRIHMSNLDTVSLRERDIQQLSVVININKDGTVEILKPDPRLTPEEVAQLKQDADTWNLFPALEEGKPIEFRVKIPLNL